MGSAFKRFISKHNVAYIPFLIVLLILTVNRIYAQESSIKSVRLMFYNVENLFDIYNDTAKADDDFLPKGVLRWNETRYRKKINAVYQTVVAAGEWNPPEIVAFCEVENKNVLEDLVYGTYLAKFNYSIIHEDSPDQRGIDVCLIYRKEYISVIEYSYWIPTVIDQEMFTSRSVLYTKFQYAGDTIHLIVNHWPSRRGGVLAGEGIRMNISSMIRGKVDSINSMTKGGAKIIILGDFNCSPADLEIQSLTSPSESGRTLVNLSEKKADEGIGTYRYMGTWEMIDQVIVSSKLLSCKAGLYTGVDQAIIFRPDFLLARDPKYPGVTPFSTYRGYRYQGGFSDHLPILLDLKERDLDFQE
jgi:hypothetical protein